MVGVWAGKFILWVAMMSIAWVLTKVVSFADRYGRVGLALSIAGLVSVGALYLFSVGGEGQLHHRVRRLAAGTVEQAEEQRRHAAAATAVRLR